MGVVSVDFQLFEDWEGGAVVLLAEFDDFFGGSGFLTAELVASEWEKKKGDE